MDGGWLRRKVAEAAPDERETVAASESEGEADASPRARRRRNRVSLLPSDASSSEEENDASDLDRLLHEDDSAEEDDGHAPDAGHQLHDQLELDDERQWDRLAQRHPGLFMFHHVPLARRGNEIAMHLVGGGGGEIVDVGHTQDDAQEIDLTTLSSDSEGEASRFGHAAEDDEDDEVEIVGSTAPLAPVPIQRVGAQGSSRGSPTRKRRRRSAAPDPSRTFNTHSAESTNISLENNETIERFKASLKCSVCLEVIQDMTSTICGHVYCGKCIRLAISVTHKCPLCQRPLRPTDIHGLFF